MLAFRQVCVAFVNDGGSAHKPNVPVIVPFHIDVAAIHQYGGFAGATVCDVCRHECGACACSAGHCDAAPAFPHSHPNAFTPNFGEFDVAAKRKSLMTFEFWPE